MSSALYTHLHQKGNSYRKVSCLLLHSHRVIYNLTARLLSRGAPLLMWMQPRRRRRGARLARARVEVGLHLLGGFLRGGLARGPGAVAVLHALVAARVAPLPARPPAAPHLRKHSHARFKGEPVMCMPTPHGLSRAAAASDNQRISMRLSE